MGYKRYTDEFKRSAVALVVEQKCSANQAAESLGIRESTLQYWLKKHRENGGAVSSVEEKGLRARNAELERENQRLKLERDILKKAAAFFAREQP
jgi:transposase